MQLNSPEEGPENLVASALCQLRVLPIITYMYMCMYITSTVNVYPKGAIARLASSAPKIYRACWCIC